MTQEEMLSQMNSMLQSLQQVNASQAETIIRLTRQNESLQNRLNEPDGSSRMAEPPAFRSQVRETPVS